MGESRYCVDGRRVAHADYVLPADDDGLLRGLAVFETLRFEGGKLFRADAHIRRLVESAAALEVPCETTLKLRSELEASVEDLPVSARVQLTLTAGGRRLIEVTPLNPDLPGSTLRVATRPWEPPDWLDARAKHCSRAINRVACRLAGVDEVFWIGRDGCLTEGTRSNIFAVVDDRLVTPPDDGRILCGVTRAALLELAYQHNLPVAERPLALEEPMTELYATSSVRDLAPVVELDGRPAPGVGPVGRRLAAFYEELLQRECGP